jgi:hypothetical protein
MPFERFHEVHGAGHRYRAVDPDTAERLASRVPAAFVQLIQEDGLCRYRRQLLFTVDDRDLAAARLAWFPGFPQISVIGRTAWSSCSTTPSATRPMPSAP